MDREKIVELLKGLGMTDEEIAGTAEETLEAMGKSLTENGEGEGLTVEEFKAIALDEQAGDAFEAGDAEAFALRVADVLKSMDNDEDDAGGMDTDAGGDDDDEEEDDEDDLGGPEDDDEEDDDEEDAAKRKKADDILAKLRAGMDGKAKSKVKKSLADFMAVDEIEDTDEQLGMALVAKAITDFVEQETGDLRKQVRELSKALKATGEELKQVAKQPAGRTIAPYTLGETEPIAVADKGISERIIKAQAAGIIGGADAMRFHELAKGDAESVELVSKRLDAAEKANAGQ